MQTILESAGGIGCFLGVGFIFLVMFLRATVGVSPRLPENRQITKYERQQTAMDTRARAGRIEDNARNSRVRGVLTTRDYPGLTVRSEIETVNGEVVEDPQLGSGAPQLSSGGRPQLQSGEDYAIAKKRQMRGW